MRRCAGEGHGAFTRAPMAIFVFLAVLPEYSRGASRGLGSPSAPLSPFGASELKEYGAGFGAAPAPSLAFTGKATITSSAPTTSLTKGPTQPSPTKPTQAPSVTSTATGAPATHTPTPHPTPKATVSVSPTKSPTKHPVPHPTTSLPVPVPTAPPAAAPTSSPTISRMPYPNPTPLPTTAFPSGVPVVAPTANPTPVPTKLPVQPPSPVPSPAPTSVPWPAPTETPTHGPTHVPSPLPSAVPTTSIPTRLPTKRPSPMPTLLPTIVNRSTITSPKNGQTFYNTNYMDVNWTVADKSSQKGKELDVVLFGLDDHGAPEWNMTINHDPVLVLDQHFLWHINVTTWGREEGAYKVALVKCNDEDGHQSWHYFSRMPGSFEILLLDDDLEDDDDRAAVVSAWLQIAGFVMLGVIVIICAAVAYPRRKETSLEKNTFEFNGYEELLNEHPSITTAFDAMTTNRSDWLVDLKSLDIKEMVGIGASAQVFRAIFCGQAVAVKRMPVMIRKGDESLALLEQEAQALSRLHHPNIVGFFGIAMDSSFVYIVTEFMPRTLLTRMETGSAVTSDNDSYNAETAVVPFEPMRVSEWLRIALAVGHGLEYLHSRNCLHRDIKPSNILISSASASTAVKLCDFGLAKSDHQKDATVTMTNGVGTPAYMSPEVMLGDAHAHGFASDIYAFGLVLYGLWMCEQPFAAGGMTPLKIMMRISTGKRPPIDNVGMPLQLKRLICDMWNQDPRHRPTASEVTRFVQEQSSTMPLAQKNGLVYGSASADSRMHSVMSASESVISTETDDISVQDAVGFSPIASPDTPQLLAGLAAKEDAEREADRYNTPNLLPTGRQLSRQVSKVSMRPEASDQPQRRRDPAQFGAGALRSPGGNLSMAFNDDGHVHRRSV